jgi:beta-aspartyl-peptidase (threonine type)
MKKYAIAIHGGAGTVLRSVMTAEKETQYKDSLRQALITGEAVLKNNGSSLDAVEAAVMALENDPLFNAGRGSVFTHDGKNEMDASIMNGANLAAGAVSGIQNIKNPVSLARAIMEKSEHVFLSGSGAVDFAKRINAEFMPDDYFFVQMRYEQLQHALKIDSVQLDHSSYKTESGEKKIGTVGAVAIDRKGDLAAATSTGGMTNKRHGRIGDTPVIGAGTYASNSSCAVSCTGHGEFFIRAVAAYDVACLIEYKGMSLEDASHHVVKQKLLSMGGEGGLIAIDREGNIALPFNSDGMYRASLKEGEEAYLGIYRD